MKSMDNIKNIITGGMIDLPSVVDISGLCSDRLCNRIDETIGDNTMSLWRDLWFIIKEEINE
jgi:hypothetical protein